MSEPAAEQYGKVMSISDDLVGHYAELCCSWNLAEVAALDEQLVADPFAAKHAVARRIVELDGGDDAAAEAADKWTRRFSNREIIAEDLPEFAVEAGPLDLVEVLVTSGLVTSKGDARRQLAQGAIKLDGTKLATDSDVAHSDDLVGKVLQRGKRHAVRVVAA